jgi:hypothetical protein
MPSVKVCSVYFGDVDAILLDLAVHRSFYSYSMKSFHCEKSLSNCEISCGQIFDTDLHVPTLLPRTDVAMIPYSTHVFLLHPSFPRVVAEERVGTS